MKSIDEICYKERKNRRYKKSDSHHQVYLCNLHVFLDLIKKNQV